MTPHLAVVLVIWLALDTIVLLSALEWLRQLDARRGISDVSLPAGTIAPQLPAKYLDLHAGGSEQRSGREPPNCPHFILFVSPTCPGCRALVTNLRTRMAGWLATSPGLVTIVVQSTKGRAASSLFSDKPWVADIASVVEDDSGAISSSFLISRVPYVYILDSLGRVMAAGTAEDRTVSRMLASVTSKDAAGHPRPDLV